MITYEQRLNQDVRWALMEGSMHFEKESAVYKTLERITGRLDELGIPYALVGAMAMFLHGFRRFTEYVDLLVTPDDLKTIHQELVGLGYRPPFAGSKHLRDTESGVRVEFITTGDYPGDGKPKAIAFPEPKQASVDIDGMRCLTLAKLIELKLASGMTNPARVKDIGDVQELIKALSLPEELTEQLDASVAEEYHGLWIAVQDDANSH